MNRTGARPPRMELTPSRSRRAVNQRITEGRQRARRSGPRGPAAHLGLPRAAPGPRSHLPRSAGERRSIIASKSRRVVAWLAHTPLCDKDVSPLAPAWLGPSAGPVGGDALRSCPLPSTRSRQHGLPRAVPSTPQTLHLVLTPRGAGNATLLVRRERGTTPITRCGTREFRRLLRPCGQGKGLGRPEKGRLGPPALGTPLRRQAR